MRTKSARLGAIALIAMASFTVFQALAIAAYLDGIVVSRWPSPVLLIAGAMVFGVLAAFIMKDAPRAIGRAVLSLTYGMTLAVVATGLLSASHRIHPDSHYLPGAERRAETLVLDDGSEALYLRPAHPPRALVVIVHGTGNDRVYGFWRLLDVTLDADVAVLTANLPGHGVGGTDLFTLEASRRRITALVALARRLSDAPVIVLGQSLGAALVLDAWVGQISFDAAVAVSAPVEVHVGPGLIRELGAFTNKAAWSTLRYGTLAEVLPAAGSFRRREFPIRVAGDMSYIDAVAHAVREMALIDRLQSASARRIAPPVLLVHGRADGVVPFAQAETLARALGDHVTPLFRDGIHHLDPLFDEPTLAVIRDWITSRAKLSRPH